MIIEGQKITFTIYESYCLKDKRRVLKGLIERIGKRFNVSIAEVEENDTWNLAVVGVACVSNRQNSCEKILQRVLDFMDNNEDIEITKVEGYY